MKPSDENKQQPHPEDKEDLKAARSEKKPSEDKPSFWKSLGPGFITGAADDDPTAVAAYSVAGAQYAYRLLWLVPFCIPLMIAVQEMCGRVAIVTGKGLAAVIKERYPRWILYCAIAMLFVANVINIYADLNAIAASAEMLTHVPYYVCLLAFTVLITGLIVFVPYRHYVKLLKWGVLSLLAYVIVVFLPGVKNDWPVIARSLFIPSWGKGTPYLLVLVGFLGTTISPYLFFWQAGEEVEEQIAEGVADAPGKRIKPVDKGEIRRLRTDTTVGMVGSQAIAFFMLICAAGTLHVMGKTDINTPQQATKALLPLGKAAYSIFTIGIVSTGLLAIPTLAGSAAYGISETFGWKIGLYRRAGRAKAFYFTIAIAVVLGFILNLFHGISAIKGLLYSAAVNGVAAPPLIFLLLLICNNKDVMGDRRNRIWSNLFGGLTVVFMSAASIFFLWALATGKAS